MNGFKLTHSLLKDIQPVIFIKRRRRRKKQKKIIKIWIYTKALHTISGGMIAVAAPSPSSSLEAHLKQGTKLKLTEKPLGPIKGSFVFNCIFKLDRKFPALCHI